MVTMELNNLLEFLDGRGIIVTDLNLVAESLTNVGLTLAASVVSE